MHRRRTRRHCLGRICIGIVKLCHLHNRITSLDLHVIGVIFQPGMCPLCTGPRLLLIGVIRRLLGLHDLGNLDMDVLELRADLFDYVLKLAAEYAVKWPCCFVQFLHFGQCARFCRCRRSPICLQNIYVLARYEGFDVGF